MATEKLNIIAGMMSNEIISPLIYNYNTDASFFNIWLERHLLPELPEKSVIVLDNASFHNTKKTKEILRIMVTKYYFCRQKIWQHLK